MIVYRHREEQTGMWWNYLLWIRFEEDCRVAPGHVCWLGREEKQSFSGVRASSVPAERGGIDDSRFAPRHVADTNVSSLCPLADLPPRGST